MEKQQPIEGMSGTYETGVTQPGKSSRGIIAVLLMVVIFLSGVVTALGLMNVHLFRQLQTDSTDQVAPVHFEAPAAEGGEAVPYGRMDVGSQAPELGIWYVFVSGVMNDYYEIPQGVMVTSVDARAKAAGIQSGDIVMGLNGQRVTTEQTLQSALQTCTEGENVELVLYRVSQKKEFKIAFPFAK